MTTKKTTRLATSTLTLTLLIVLLLSLLLLSHWVQAEESGGNLRNKVQNNDGNAIHNEEDQTLSSSDLSGLIQARLKTKLETTYYPDSIDGLPNENFNLSSSDVIALIDISQPTWVGFWEAFMSPWDYDIWGRYKSAVMQCFVPFTVDDDTDLVNPVVRITRNGNRTSYCYVTQDALRIWNVGISATYKADWSSVKIGGNSPDNPSGPFDCSKVLPAEFKGATFAGYCLARGMVFEDKWSVGSMCHGSESCRYLVADDLGRMCLLSSGTTRQCNKLGVAPTGHLYRRAMFNLGPCLHCMPRGHFIFTVMHGGTAEAVRSFYQVINDDNELCFHRNVRQWSSECLNGGSIPFETSETSLPVAARVVGDCACLVQGRFFRTQDTNAIYKVISNIGEVCQLVNSVQFQAYDNPAFTDYPTLPKNAWVRGHCMTFPVPYNAGSGPAGIVRVFNASGAYCHYSPEVFACYGRPGYHNYGTALPVVMSFHGECACLKKGSFWETRISGVATMFYVLAEGTGASCRVRPNSGDLGLLGFTPGTSAPFYDAPPPNARLVGDCQVATLPVGSFLRVETDGAIYKVVNDRGGVCHVRDMAQYEAFGSPAFHEVVSFPVNLQSVGHCMQVTPGDSVGSDSNGIGRFISVSGDWCHYSPEVFSCYGRPPFHHYGANLPAATLQRGDCACLLTGRFWRHVPSGKVYMVTDQARGKSCHVRNPQQYNCLAPNGQSHTDYNVVPVNAVLDGVCSTPACP